MVRPSAKPSRLLLGLLLLPLLLPGICGPALIDSVALPGRNRNRSDGGGGGGGSGAAKRPSPGCRKATTLATNAMTNRTLPLTGPAGGGGGGRLYTVWVPASYDTATPAPLIISLHGAGRTAAWQADLDRLADPAFNADHVVVYGQSTTTNTTTNTGSSSGEEGGQDRFWEGYPGLPPGVDDVAYLMAVLDAVEADLCVDAARVYAAGKSQGGGLAAVLACDAAASRRVAAFASVSGAYYYYPARDGVGADDCGVRVGGGVGGGGGAGPAATLLPACDPGRGEIPFLAFHGGNDTTIPYAGGPRRGFCLPAVRRWVDGWVARDGLAARPAETRNLTRDATVFVYGGGEEEEEEDDGDDDDDTGDGRRGLVTFVYDGDHVGHDWPATFPNTDSLEHGTQPASFNASSVIMGFFRNYSLP